MGLELDENLQAKDAEPRCGLHIIDLRAGDVVHWLRLEAVVKELYDAAVLPNITRPMTIDFVSDEITRMIRLSQRGNFR